MTTRAMSVSVVLYLAACAGPATTAPGSPSVDGTDQSDTTGADGADGADGVDGADGAPASACGAHELLPIGRESLRLTDVQLAHTLRDLFPFDLDLSQQPTITAPVKGFTTYPGANEVLLNHQGQLVDLAESVAIQALDHLTELVPCNPAQGVECAEAFLAEFLPRVFRRPVSEADIAPYRALYETVTTGEDALEPQTAFAALIQAALLAPELQYLVEVGEPTPMDGVRILTGYELASRLSYLLWNRAPDEQLLAHAADGTLQTREALYAEAQRLLDDPRSTDTLQRFFTEWFHTTEPHYEPAGADLGHAFDQEFRRTTTHLVRHGGTISQLLNGTSSMLNAELASYYGIADAPSTGSDDWVWTELPDERHGGLLTSAQVAISTSHNNSTSIIHRGVMVREQLLCGDLGTPPPGATSQNPILGPDATVRDRMEARMAMTPCGDCHQLMDHVGIGMEDLDERGQFRTTYTNGHPVDSDGQLRYVSGIASQFSGTLDLAQRLATSDAFEACATEQWMRYAIGRKLTLGKACHIERILDAARTRGGQLRHVLLEITQSDAFIYRAEDVQ